MAGQAVMAVQESEKPRVEMGRRWYVHVVRCISESWSIATAYCNKLSCMQDHKLRIATNSDDGDLLWQLAVTLTTCCNTQTPQHPGCHPNSLAAME